MHRRRLQDRPASVTLEFILVLPLLIVTLFAVAQFAVAQLVRQSITQAAIVGAREAGKHEDIYEVARAVDGVLQGAHHINVADVTVNLSGGLPPYPVTVSPPAAGSGVQIALEVGTTAKYYFPPASDPNYKNYPLPATAPLADEVRVTVSIEMKRSPMFNALYSFSPEWVNFANRHMSASTLVKVE